MKVCRWAKILGLRLSAVVVTGSRRFLVRKKCAVQDVLARIRRFRGKLPADFRFDRDEANENF